MTVTIILARQRSGTGALGSVLNKHHMISYFGEVFHDDAIDSPPNYFWFLKKMVEKNVRAMLPNSNDARLDEYLTFLESQSKKPNVAIDVKYRSTHHFNAHWFGLGEAPTMFKLLRERSIGILHIMRRNHLKTYISGRLAEMNEVWHATAEAKIKVRKLKVNIQKCLGFLQSQAEEDVRLQKALRDHPKILTLDYAEIFDSDGHISIGTAEKLAHFFDVGPFETRRPAFVKQTSDKLIEVIENYDQVYEALLSTPYGWMLNTK